MACFHSSMIWSGGWRCLMSLSEPRGSSIPSNNNHPQSAFGWSEFWDDGKWKRENNFWLFDRQRKEGKF